jgi:predicted nucleic acid-binding protein
MIVVDTNILIGYAVPNHSLHRACAALRAADPHWVVPPLWRYECLNVLVKLVGAGQLTLSKAQGLLLCLTETLKENERSPDESLILDIAAKHRITAYDGTYVALADSLGCVLVTDDKEVLAKFPAMTKSPSSFAG